MGAGGEGAIELHPAVRSAVVIGLPAGVAERVHAIVDTAGRDISEDDLQRMLAEWFPTVRVPDTWEWADTPLRDLAGKAQRLRLRAGRTGAPSTRARQGSSRRTS